MRALITEDLVARAPELLAGHGSPRELVVRDTKLTGFIVRLRATGRHTYGAIYARARVLTLGRTDRLTAHQARRAAREALAQAALTGTPALVDRRRAATLGRFLDEAYAPWAETHLRHPEATLTRLRRHFAGFLETRLEQITPFAIEAWRAKRLRDGRRRSTVNRDVADLKAALSRAVAWGWLRAHPLTSVKPYKLDRRGVVRYLTDDERARLLAALEARDDAKRRARESANAWRRERGYPELPPLGHYPDHLTPLVLLAMHTGLRRGELFGLRWRDVDLARGLVTVHGAGAKSGQTRHVPLNATARAALAAWRPATVDPEATVFPSRDGEPLGTIKTAWLKVLRRAQIPRFRFHDLRHDFASRLVMAGVDLNTVRELLGHADIGMVLRYAHLAPDATAAAVEKIAGGAR